MVTVSLALLILAAGPAPNEEKLLAKGDGYFLHAVRGGPYSRGQFGEQSYGRDVFDRPGKYILTHLNTTTGKLTRIHAGGQWGNPLVLGGINRGFLYRQYILGVTVDEKHLYLLLARSLEVTEYFGIGNRERKIQSAVIQVFQLRDAELVQEVSLPNALHKEEEILTFDQLDRVPLEVTKTGILVGEEKKPHARFWFTDQGKLEPTPKKK